jgi:pyroglutamyl-peptidase
MALTVLIIGFGAFAGAPFNPATTLPQRLAARRRPALDAVRRVPHTFRTSYATVDEELPALLARVRPDVVLLFGVATRTPHLRIETRARNAASVLFSDVDGHRPERMAIRPNAPAALMGRAPHRVLLTAARAQRVPAQLSHRAGRYLCNYSYWRALEAAPGGRPLVQFVHVPTVRRGPAVLGKRRRLTDADLLRAGEAILLTLVRSVRARQREARPSTIETFAAQAAA